MPNYKITFGVQFIVHVEGTPSPLPRMEHNMAVALQCLCNAENITDEVLGRIVLGDGETFRVIEEPRAAVLHRERAQEGEFHWVTDAMFERGLQRVLDEMPTAQLLQVPEVAQAVREHLNNDVLKRLETMRWDGELEDEMEEDAFGPFRPR